MPIRITRMLAWWLTRNATHVVHGRQGGGDVHLPLGKVGDLVGQLVRGSGVRKRRQGSGESDAYVIPVFDDISGKTTDLTVRVMAEHYIRAGEVQLASQTPGSATALPVWERRVKVSDDDTPKQAGALALCADGQFRAFVLNERQLQDISAELVDRMSDGRTRNKATPVLFDEEIEIPRSIDPETVRATDSRILKRMIERFEEQQEHVRERRLYIRNIRSWERRPQVRRIALSAYGPNCMIQGCKCTERLSPSQLMRVVDCHHVEEVAGGGTDRLQNLLVLCPTHHAIFHRCETEFEWLSETEGRLTFLDSDQVLNVVRRRLLLV